MWPIGGTLKKGDYGVTDFDEAIRAIQLAHDEGITLFDTAPAYGNGLAEEILGQALEGRRDKAFITTKCGIYYDFDRKIWIRDSSHDAIVRSAEQSLERLRTDVIDLLLIHWPDADTTPDSAMSGLEDLQKSGKVRFVGVSNFNIKQIESYEEYGSLDAQQVGYNIFDRRIESEMIPRCRRSGMGIMAYGSLCHGLLTGTWKEDIKFSAEDWRSQGDIFGLKLFTSENLPTNVRVADRLQDFAASIGLTLPQLGLAWVLNNREVSVALVGMASPREVRENVVGASKSLNESHVHQISEIMKAAQGTVATHDYDFNNPRKN
jgi:aryl-alcohol dehydrogenase-like predicted oxidoreductase